jgi:hypothetical protein
MGVLLGPLNRTLPFAIHFDGSMGTALMDFEAYRTIGERVSIMKLLYDDQELQGRSLSMWCPVPEPTSGPKRGCCDVQSRRQLRG